jgi:thiamine-monophosphate kinase
LSDDAAVVLLGGGQRCVLTSDMLTDEVDFRLEVCDPRRVGRKALAVNLSDLAAMAARPVAVVVSLALPRRGGQRLARQLYEGLIPLAEEFDIAVAGGDTNSWDHPLVISVTALGEVAGPEPLRRSGARPGDAVLVTGAFGGSSLGKHLDFQPRVREALLLNANYQLHAAIDVSDGLSLDLWRMVEESRCGAELDLSAIPIDPSARQLAASLDDGVSALDHALSDGEDFELILAVPAGEAERLLEDQPLSTPVTQIGRCTSERGLWRQLEGGAREALAPRGYEHGLDG